MEKYSFFNAVLTEQGTYDRVYKAEDIADYFSSFIGNGVYPNLSTNLQIASSNDGMKIYAKPGKAWINGYYYENTEDLTFRIDNADAQYDRIDDVVLRLDFLQRTITIQIKKGNPAISPAEQALQRDSDIHELRLAKVYVTKGAINITDVDITDTRQNSEDCGIVSGVVQQINTDDLFLQYNTAFDTWFEHIKDKLSKDAAGNLQAQIDEVKENYAINNHASSSITYGVGNDSLYGHLKLTDDVSSSNVSNGIAATPQCVLSAVTPQELTYSFINGITQADGDTTKIYKFQNIVFISIHAELPKGSGWTQAITINGLGGQLSPTLGKAPYGNRNTPSNIAYRLDTNVISFYLESEISTTVGFSCIGFLE